MNERIQELWKQCQNRQVVETYRDGAVRTTLINNHEKFAELLVKECFDKLTPYLDDQSIDDIELELKEHFGMKS